MTIVTSKEQSRGLGDTETSITDGLRVEYTPGSSSGYGEMFSDMAINIGLIISSGIKTVDVDTHSHRYSICMRCDMLTSNGRCKKCGCFMKLKSKFAAMSCPINLWEKK